MDIGPPAGPTWCLTPRNPLFLRQRAPRLHSPADLPHRTGIAPGPGSDAVPFYLLSKKPKGSGTRGAASHFFPYSKEIPGRGFPTALFHGKPIGIPKGFSGRNSRFYSCRRISAKSSRRILRMGPPEKIPISSSLPTSFPSAGRSLPCRRCWRKPSRSRFCPGSGQPSSSPARNPHRPCRNPFSPPE